MELTFADLYTRCEKCGGSGNFTETTRSGGFISHTSTSYGACPACKGAGGILSETGKAIAQLVKKIKENERLMWQ